MKVNVAGIALLLISCCSVTSLADNLPDHPVKGKDGRIRKASFKAKVVLVNDRIVTGHFINIANDSLHLLDMKSGDVARIPITDIQMIKIRRKGAIWKGAVIGVVAGVTAGIALASVSLNSHRDSQAEPLDEFYAYYFGFMFGYAGGGLTGTLIGMHQKKFKINRHLEDRERKRLQRFNAEAPR